jgi:hypothetical protein
MMTENRCFPHTPNRDRIGLQNRGIARTENPVGFGGYTETSDDRFSDTPEKSLCVPGGVFRSGRIGRVEPAAAVV